MSNRVSIGNLLIAQELHDLVADEIAPGTGVDPQHFWKAFEAIVTDLAPKNRALLDRGDELQAKLDAWHREHRDDFDFASYKDFLVDIGYLLPEGDDFEIATTGVDEEVARDFILFGQPDVTIVVVDATRLERNLNLVLQILEITDRVVVCLNLMDEAKRHGIAVDPKRLEGVGSLEELFQLFTSAEMYGPASRVPPTGLDPVNGPRPRQDSS